MVDPDGPGPKPAAWRQGVMAPLQPRFAKGGNITRTGWGIFGEEGPEIGVAAKGTRIFPAPVTDALMKVAEAFSPDGSLVAAGNALPMPGIGAEISDALMSLSRSLSGPAFVPYSSQPSGGTGAITLDIHDNSFMGTPEENSAAIMDAVERGIQRHLSDGLSTYWRS